MYSDELWTAWSQQEEENYQVVKDKTGKLKRKYLKKGYQHFDSLFWFPDQKSHVQKILKDKLRKRNPASGRMEWYAFAPFIKTLLKTPRYKFQDEEEKYDLETKVRPICYASHIDSLLLGYYSFALTKTYEDYISKHGFSDCILAYRSNLGKCNIQFAKEVFDEVRARGACTAIALDIKGYFDHIDHAILLQKWQKVIGEKLPDDQFKLYKALTQYTYVNKTSLLKKYKVNLKKSSVPIYTFLDFVPGTKIYEKYDDLRKNQLLVKNERPDKTTGRLMGIPQGSAISALLSNIYLLDFDRMMSEKANQEGFLYRRYCDDILIICGSEKAVDLQKFTIDNIKSEYLLTIQDKKVETTLFDFNSEGKLRGFDLKKMTTGKILHINASNQKKYYSELQYLGFQFNGQRVIVRPSSLSRYFRKMAARIVKTVSMAYSGKIQSDKIWKEQLFHRYTHLGKRNFLAYVFNASKPEYLNSKGEWKEGMNDPAIRRQVRRHFDILMRKLIDKNAQRYIWKMKKGKYQRYKTALKYF